MILTTAWIMLLATLRDKAALAMAFVLPPVLFVVFAAIFAGTSGKDLKLKVGLRLGVETAESRQLADALRGDRNLRIVTLDHGGENELAELVQQGAVDVGILIRSDLKQPGSAPVLIVQNETKALAAAIARGEIEKLVAARLPSVEMSRLLARLRQAGQLDPHIEPMLLKAIGSNDTKTQPDALVATKSAGGTADMHGNVLYYAASVTAIFLLFGAVHGAFTLIDERTSGTFDRLRLRAGGLASVVLGKLLYLVGQGAVQAIVVYLVARLLYDAAFDWRLTGLWLGTCLLCAAAAAALALLACALCRTRKQAEGLTTFAVLVVSAAGGSMVPRYLMPPWFQSVSWFTPNSWMIEALERTVLPGTRLGDLSQSWTVLAAMTAVGTMLAAGVVLHGSGARSRGI